MQPWLLASLLWLDILKSCRVGVDIELIGWEVLKAMLDSC